MKAVDVANLSDDTGGVDLADAGYGSKRVGDDLKLLLNGFIQSFDLRFQCPHGSDGYAHRLIHGIIDRFWQAIGAFCGGLYSLRSGLRIGKSAPSGCLDEGCQFIQIGVGQIVHRGESLHEGKRCGTAVWNVPILGESRAFEEQVVCEVLFLPRKGLYHAESGAS